MRGTFKLNTQANFAISVLIQTDTNHNWLLGDRCSEITRFDSVSSLIDFSFKTQKWYWPFKRDYVQHCRTLRSCFVDHETKQPIVAFKSDLFELICLFEGDKMHVSCKSERHRHHLFAKLTGFLVYSEIVGLECSSFEALNTVT